MLVCWGRAMQWARPQFALGPGRAPRIGRAPSEGSENEEGYLIFKMQQNMMNYLKLLVVGHPPPAPLIKRNYEGARRILRYQSTVGSECR